jgi:surface antigen/LysM repeat protein
MSNDAAGSHGGFDAGLPLTPNSQNRPLDPLLGSSGAPLQLSPDQNTTAGDSLLGGSQFAPLNNTAEELTVSGVVEEGITEAKAFLSKTKTAIEAIKGDLSEVVQTGSQEIQASLKSPEHPPQQAMSNIWQKFISKAGDRARQLMTGIEYVSPSEDEPAIGLGSGTSADGSIEIKQPDFTSAAYTTNNIYAKSGVAPASVIPNSHLGASKGNCTWFANGRAEELGADPQLLDKMTSHAYNWDNQALAAGITLSDRPQPGMVAIAQWENGHVAVVERDNGDGTVTISESSYDAPGGRYDYLYDTRTISIDKIDRFILIPKVNAGIDSGDAGLSEVSNTPDANAGESSEQSAPSGGNTGEQFSIGDKSYVWTKRTIESGDMLSQISLDTTGSAGNYNLIAKRNGIPDPDRIKAGQTIDVPQAVTDGLQPQIGGTDSVAGQDVQVGVGDGLTGGNGGDRVVSVESGDSLSGISLEETGSASNYDEIAAYNGIDNPNLIFPGQQIKIPSIEDVEISSADTQPSPLDTSLANYSTSSSAITPEIEPIPAENPIVDVIKPIPTENISTDVITPIPVPESEGSIEKRSTVVNTNQTLSQYEVPKNAIDTITGLFGNNQPAEIVFVTSSNLVLDDYQAEQNGDGSVTVKTTIFNPYTFDALVEIYDGDGQLVRIADEVIGGKTAPEHLIEAGIDLTTSQFGVMGRNFTDIRNNSKSSEIEFTLNPGEYADIAVDSNQTFLYNTLIATFDFLNSLPDWKEWKIDSKADKKLLLDFIKSLKSEGIAEITQDSLLTVFSGSSSWSDKFGSQEVQDLLGRFEAYLAKTAVDTSVDQGLEITSEAVQNGIHLLNPLVATASKWAFNIAKAGNVANRMMIAVKTTQTTIEPTRLELQSEIIQVEGGEPGFHHV